jgi:hypothetical protein
MNRRRFDSPPGIGVGGASILMVFAVLCLTIFAVLSLVTARSERALAERHAEAVTNYYAADCLAAEVYDALSKAGDLPESVLGVSVSKPSVSSLSYTVPIDGDRELCVLLRREGDTLRILEWREAATGEWEPDTRIRVWEGPAADNS